MALLTSLVVSSLHAKLTQHRQSCCDSDGIALVHIAALVARVLVCGAQSHIHFLDDIKGESDVFAVLTIDSPTRCIFCCLALSVPFGFSEFFLGQSYCLDWICS